MNKNKQLRSYLSDRFSPKTTEGYAYDIERFLSIHPNGANYEYTEITEFLHAMVKKNLSQGSQNRVLSSLKVYYEYLRDSGYRTDNPIAGFRFETKRRKQMQLQDLLTKDELLSMYLARPEKDKRLELRNKIILSLLIFQGIASGELIKLTPNNINLETEILHIPRSRRLNGRDLKLNHTQLEMLKEYYGYMQPVFDQYPKPRLFLTARNEWVSIGTVRSLVRGYKFIVPGKTVDTQSIRMSVISNWLNVDKKSLAETQYLCGHKWPSTTQAYKRLDVDSTREQIQKFHPLR